MRLKNTPVGTATARKTTALACIALLGLALAGPTYAQDNGTPPGGFGGGPGVPPPDGFGGGPGGPPPDGFGGGSGGAAPNGFGGQGTAASSAAQGNVLTGPSNATQANGQEGQNGASFAAGTVKAVDAAADTLTLTTRNGDRVVKVGQSAQITSSQTVSVTDLKVGDQVRIQGVPTGIIAATITVGQPPAGLPGAGGFGGGQVGGGANGGQSFAAASGTIQALPTKTDAHLALSLGSDAVLYLKLADGARLTKYVPLKISDVKVGDRIVAVGQSGSDGTLTASAVGVNFPQGGPAGGGTPPAVAARPQ